MNYFICGFGPVQLGIPAEWALRIISVSRVQSAVYETENQEAFISLPALFRQKDLSAPHGIILKAVDASNGALLNVKTILLSPKIEKDLDIPEGNIQRLPRSLLGMFRYFRGACFNGQDVILVLSPETVLESIR